MCCYLADEPKTGFAGWYQRQCHKVNRSGLLYLVTEDDKGEEIITVYNPECLVDESIIEAQEDDPQFAEEIQADLETKVKQLENSENF